MTRDKGYTDAEDETLLMLRAVSQTSQRLRNFTLPLLWSVVQLGNVNSVGKLRDAFRLMPHLASYTRVFALRWSMWVEAGIEDLVPYPDAHGSALDMAFIDRGALWDETREAFGAEIMDSVGCSHFVHQDVVYFQPGDPREDSDGPPAIHVNRSGPDGKGEDPRIKSARDFNEAMTEIVAQIAPTLQSFSWSCQVTPMSLGTFEALKGARELRHLHTDLWFPRKFQHCKYSCDECSSHVSLTENLIHSLLPVPLWELASVLTTLSIGTLAAGESYLDRKGERWMYDCQGTHSDILGGIVAFEVPSEPRIGDDVAIIGTLWRTIVTAARGMRVRELPMGIDFRDALWKPFATPELFPAWVGVDRWDSWSKSELYGWDSTFDCTAAHSELWPIAAIFLRRALFHMSSLPLAQREACIDPTRARLLARSDVQAMHSEFQLNGLPRVADPDEAEYQLCDIEKVEYAYHSPKKLLTGTPIELYFRWLRDDAQLAQHVADAWNAVVERGGAALLRCYCHKCYEEEGSV